MCLLEEEERAENIPLLEGMEHRFCQCTMHSSQCTIKDGGDRIGRVITTIR